MTIEMWSIPKPEISAKTSFNQCVSGMRNTELQSRLKAIEEDIVFAETEYVTAASMAQLNRISPHNHVGRVSIDEMKWVYAQKMVRKNSHGRWIYNQLMLSPRNERCPFCGQRRVTTLDHILPQSKYAAYAVTPVNLVPSCFDCNKVKTATIPGTPEDVVLHPYFDNIQGDRCLYAEVIALKPASLMFFVEGPESWDQVTATRVRNQFERLNLNELYASHAAEEILNIRHQLINILNVGGAEAVQAHLTEVGISRKSAQINSWQTAMYEALSMNDWFCSGGFN